VAASPDEQDWLGHLQDRLPPGPVGETWVGDDAAVLVAPDGWILFTIDSAVAGVHADLSLVSAADLGWKALARAVSDVAAMGGDPWRAVVAVSGPPDVDIGCLYDGIGQAASVLDCPVVGGDLSSAGQLVVTVAVTGVVSAGENPPVLRSGALAGDRIWVTGPLGRAAAGLRILRAAGARGAPGARGAAGQGAGVEAGSAERSAAVSAHARPVPRLAAGRSARRSGATAMIDVSDGLAIDLGRLADASAVSVELTGVPVSAPASQEEALGGGDDYELVICAPEAVDLEACFRYDGIQAPVEIGRCGPGPAGSIRLEGREIDRSGWRHWSG